MGREYPGSSAVALWVALAVVGTVHLWARPAYAHFSSCDTVFSCSGGILDFATGQQVPLEHGGTEADLSATGGAGQYVKQESSGGAMTVGVIPAGDLPSAIDAANIADGSVSDAEYQRLDGATADIQGQIDARLSVAGGTMTGQLVLDDLMLSFTESDTAQTCGAGDYGIYADLSETKFKKCENGTTTDLDTSGSVTVPKYVQTTDMDLADTDTIFFSIASGMLCATESDCKTSTQQGTTIDNVSARANKDIGGTNNTVEIACGSCTTSIATDCQSGDACVTVASTSSDTPTAADTDGVTWTAGQCCVGEIVASGNTNAGVLYVVSWTETGS
ncbi:MAG: hypothetical protein ACPGVG_19155 [Mycobacterium sp.]